jgi:hypothetical protein
MAKVTVTPATFELVNFQASDIEAAAHEVAESVGLGDDVSIDILVAEEEMQGRSKATLEGSTITVDVSGGAFESLRKAREFAPDRCRAVLGQALMRARDRLDPAFGDPPADDEIDVYLEAAWSTYIEGRLDRKGILKGRPQRRIYHFRVRHGFNDQIDRTFDQLWNGDGLTWADIEKMSQQARASVPAPA